MDQEQSKDLSSNAKHSRFTFPQKHQEFNLACRKRTRAFLWHYGSRTSKDLSSLLQSIPGPHSHKNLKKPTVVCRRYIMASRVLNRPARLCLQTHSNNDTKIQITGFHKSTRMICGSGTCQTYIFSGFIETPWLQSVHHIILVIMYVRMSMPSAKISIKMITR
ncbi:unnamed protein product [Sphagnum balticum]